MNRLSPALSRRSLTLARSVVTLAMLTLLQPVAHAQLASRISPVPTDTVVPGELVWADLVTTDVEAAVAFYARVFGWEIRRGEDPAYIELAHDGEVIGAVAEYDDDDVTPGNARWLVSISVADVDAVAMKAEQHGGQVFEAPQDFPDRGRYAVVGDDQGAVLMLLRASGGDPADNDNEAGTWGWAELWTKDLRKAVDFYEAVIGYRAVRASDKNKQVPVVLMTQNQPRATVVEIPWSNVESNWLPYIVVENGRAILQQVTDAGGALLLTSDEVEDDDGPFAAIIADPTGGVFAIQETEGSQ